ncbi:MAG: potassium-transporting ATPase subunit KdpA, partial [Bdellovibrionales bacterium]
SSFAGIAADTPFYNILLGLCILIGRFGLILPLVAIAGSMAPKNVAPPSQGTLDTTSLLFSVLLVFIVILIGALTYIPALAYGPIAEHFHLLSLMEAT